MCGDNRRLSKSLSIQGILLYCMVAHSVSAGLSCGLMQAVLSVDELMGRFRANLIIKGDAPPFVEDTWTELSIGDFHFEVRSLHPHMCIHTYVHTCVTCYVHACSSNYYCVWYFCVHMYST